MLERLKHKAFWAMVAAAIVPGVTAYLNGVITWQQALGAGLQALVAGYFGVVQPQKIVSPLQPPEV